MCTPALAAAALRDATRLDRDYEAIVADFVTLGLSYDEIVAGAEALAQAIERLDGIEL